MDRVTWIEVLGRRGEVTQRVRCEKLPVTLGRAWTNDVVLDDPRVDAMHARLAQTPDGAVVLEDAGSLNGVWAKAESGERRADSVAIAGVTTVRLGQTVLRLVPADVPVPPALPAEAPAGGVEALVTGRAAPAVVALGVALAALSLWLGEFEKDAGVKALGGAVGILVATAAWAGIWALVGRATVHRAAFMQHLAATWLAFVALDVASVVANWSGAILAADVVASVLDAGAGFAAATWLLATHLGLATLMPRRRRLVTGGFVLAAMIGVVLLVGKAADDGFDADHVTVAASIVPAPTGLLRAADVESFVQRAEALQRQVDRIADKR